MEGNELPAGKIFQLLMAVGFQCVQLFQQRCEILLEGLGLPGVPVC